MVIINVIFECFSYKFPIGLLNQTPQFIIKFKGYYVTGTIPQIYLISYGYKQQKGNFPIKLGLLCYSALYSHK